MANKVLLLDIDGVLVRDPLLLQHVKQNAVDYVRAKLPESKDPARVNSILYKTYGHTARGLQNSFKIDASDFDQKVYDKKLLNHLWSVLSSTEFQYDAKIINEIEASGWKVQLFSNAPLVWSVPVKEVLGRGSSVADRRFLKPSLRAYANFSTKNNYLFVDDAIINLHTGKIFPNWTPIHYNESVNKADFPTVKSISELAMMCETINKFGFHSIVA
jgi:hypothetical protein